MGVSSPAFATGPAIAPATAPRPARQADALSPPYCFDPGAKDMANTNRCPDQSQGSGEVDDGMRDGSRAVSGGGSRQHQGLDRSPGTDEEANAVAEVCQEAADARQDAAQDQRSNGCSAGRGGVGQVEEPEHDASTDQDQGSEAAPYGHEVERARAWTPGGSADAGPDQHGVVTEA